MSDDLANQLRTTLAKMARYVAAPMSWQDHSIAVLKAADRIEELEAKLAKLAKLTKAADRVHDSYWNSSDGIIVGMFDLGEALREARTTLAELTGGKDE